MNTSIPKTSGIYKITCIANRKFYIGSSEKLNRRWLHHLRLLRRNKHSNQHLQNAYNKYGENSFMFEIVEFVMPILLLDREQYWLDLLKPYDRTIGFNIAHNAEAPLLGMSVSEETKKKLSDINMGKEMSVETRGKISKTLTGRVFTKKHRERLSNAASKTFIVVSPDGVEMSITNLDKFCRENGLNQGNMMHVVSGRYKHCKGWKCRYA